MLLRKVSLLIESNIRGAQINHNHLTLCLKLWIAKKHIKNAIDIIQVYSRNVNIYQMHFSFFLKDEILKILIVRFVDMHKFTTAR